MVSGRPTRVLIVDDSAVMRSLLRSVILAAPGLQVAGTAADGHSALSSVETLRPDLVLLDVEMPVMDGLVTLRQLRARGHRMPVIMCSSLTQRGARVTIEALAGGASDYVTKPAGQTGPSAALQTLSQELVPKIRALAGTAQTHSILASPTFRAQPDAAAFLRLPDDRVESCLSPSAPLPASALPAVLVVGVSTGGPAALDILLPALPATFPLPVLVVQHMPELFTQLLAERLNQRCRLHVAEAAEGALVRPGLIHIARGNWHMEVLAPACIGRPATLHLTQSELENHCRPAVDVLFRTAVAAYGSGVLAVVLTGMGTDGLVGSRAIHAHGGIVLAQDQPTSAVWGMPGAVTRAGLAHRVLPLAAISPEILRLAARAPAPSCELHESVI
jgi:two-component system chemotaxis response regulator CheB